jgi:hypothetical protein
VQILARVLEIIGYARRHSDLCEDLTHSYISCDWKEVYRGLLKEQRIWDVKDLVCASIFAYGVNRTWKNFFDIEFYSSRSFQPLLNDWAVLEYDESTYFAMLYILLAINDAVASASRISPAASLARDVKATAKRCIEHARKFAADICQNSPESTKSQAYIRWLLAEEAFARQFNTSKATTPLSTALSHESFQQFPGIVVTMMTSPHSIYIPIRVENPGWNASQIKPNDILLLAFRTSQELGDTRTQVICLRELISQSLDPTDLFSTLCKLQRSEQGDSLGYLETLLCKYLCISNDEAYKELLGEISLWYAEQRLTGFADPVMQWCGSGILSTLYDRLGQQYLGAVVHTEAEGEKFHLPSDMLSLLSADFSGLGGKDSKHSVRVPGSSRTRHPMDYKTISLSRYSDFHRSQELSSAVLTRLGLVANDVFEPLTGDSAEERERYDRYDDAHSMEYELVRPGPPRRGERDYPILKEYGNPRLGMMSDNRTPRPRSPGYAETIVSSISKAPLRRAKSNDSVERRSVSGPNTNNQLVRRTGRTVTIESEPDEAKGKEPADERR